MRSTPPNRVASKHLTAGSKRRRPRHLCCRLTASCRRPGLTASPADSEHASSRVVGNQSATEDLLARRTARNRSATFAQGRWERESTNSPRETSTGTPNALSTFRVMASTAATSPSRRVAERRRAVALARHFREAEGLSIAQIADRLGRSPATVKAYFYDPSDANKRPTDSAHANNASPGSPAPRAGLGF